VEVLRRFEVGVLYVNGEGSGSLAYYALMTAAEGRAIPVVELEAGDLLDLGGGAAATVLHPSVEIATDNFNERGLVLRLSYGESSFLFTADIEELGALALLASGAEFRADVLKVPHHGGASDLNDELFNAVGPSIAVISSGADNTFGHPAEETLDLLAGLPIFRTDLHGTVRIETDGEALEFKSAR
jgi:competence protein ComEC